MNIETGTDDVDDVLSDESVTDTSIFNADEIVKSLEERVTSAKDKNGSHNIESRRRFEALQEEKRLQADLRDIDDYDLDD